MKCHHCADTHDVTVMWNGEHYHPFCMEIVKAEYNHKVAEKVRRQNLLDANPWLEDFLMEYRAREFNRD